jgi:hypothetical protein
MELLAKENLKVKNYLIENLLPWQPPSTLRNPSTPRIHDMQLPVTHNAITCDAIPRTELILSLWRRPKLQVEAQAIDRVSAANRG